MTERPRRYLLTFNCRCWGWIGVALESDTRNVRCWACGALLKEADEPAR